MEKRKLSKEELQLLQQAFCSYLNTGLQVIVNIDKIRDNEKGEMLSFSHTVSGVQVAFEGDMVIGIENNWCNFEDVMPILRPMDLTKKIIHNDVEITPIVELYKIATTEKDIPFTYDMSFNSGISYLEIFKTKILFVHCDELGFSYSQNNNPPFRRPLHVGNQRELFKMMYEWKLDVLGLLKLNLAKNYNEIK